MRYLTVTGVQTCALPIFTVQTNASTTIMVNGTATTTLASVQAGEDRKGVGEERGENSVGAVSLKKKRRHAIFDCDWSSDVCSSDLHRADQRLDDDYGQRHGDHDTRLCPSG